MDNVPHLGQVTLQAVVYAKLPDGNYHPKAVWHDSFALQFEGKNETECITELKNLIERIKNETSRLDGVAQPT